MKPGADEAIKIIIELNTAAPSFEGLHDITMTDLPPRRKASDQFFSLVFWRRLLILTSTAAIPDHGT